MTVINTIVAQQLKDFKKEVDALVEGGLSKDEAIFNVLREYVKSSRNILFEGDGYSDNWVELAEERGLNNYKTTPEALKLELNPKYIEIYEKTGVLSAREVEARNEIKLEKYSTKISIEANVLVDLVLSQIIPAAVTYQNVLVKNVKGLKDIFADEFKDLAKNQIDIIRAISTHINAIKAATDKLVIETKAASEVSNHQKQAEYYGANVKPLFDVIRYNSDELEELIDNNLWPLTKYREMLFTR